ncbi:MAG: metal ABC transporter ATP-binding protein [Candidatus Aminicenantes bacterium]|nr:MAG: metal ABC transporter ATP-binding protein [Candidatus Aminicenantes bacterium]
MDSVAAEREILIAIQNVTYSYGYGDVLKDISFPINQEDFLAIIGPNGSGKTTLLKIILGLLKPRLGKVKIMGKTVEEFADWKKIGYIPQQATHIDSLFPVSVKEVVAMGIPSSRWFLRRTREEEGRISRSLQQVGMEKYNNRRIGNLSAGQQQRVFIARALANHPKILMLDEPTTGVDAQTQGHFFEMLHRLNREEGITIVLITHEVGIINKHVAQVACLNQTLVYHGSHDEFCRSDEFKRMLADGHHLVSHHH